MVDPVFRAPPPPPPVDLPPQATPQKEPVAPVSADIGTDNPAQQMASPVSQGAPTVNQNLAEQKQQILNRLNEIKEKMISYFWYSVGGLFLLGLFFGCTMSGGQPPAPAPRGLTRIVRNTDMKDLKPICGTVHVAEACLFYVLNADIQSRNAEDFFEYVANKMERQRRQIEISNVLYANVPIAPGYFAEIVVPASR